MHYRHRPKGIWFSAILLFLVVGAVSAEDDILRFGTGSEGSVDNLSRMQNGELDIAIVQNDIAYYIYEGIRGYESFTGFTAGAPLFAEYVQLLVRDGNDKAVRIVYSLTSDDVPRKKPVVVVAGVKKRAGRNVRSISAILPVPVHTRLKR